MQVYEAEIVTWRWAMLESYGIARIKNSKQEAFIISDNCLELKKSHPRGFVDEFGKEIIIYPPELGIVWFDPFETIYFTLNPDQPNIAQNISFYNNGELTRKAAAGVAVPKPFYMQRLNKMVKGFQEQEKETKKQLVDLDDELEDEQVQRYHNYAGSTDSEEEGVNPTKSTPVKP